MNDGLWIELSKINVDSLIDAHEKGVSLDYFKLVNLLKSPKPDGHQLLNIIKVLDGQVSRLHYHCYRELIEQILKLKPWLYFEEEEHVKFVAEFFVGLIANHPFYTDLLFTALIGSLTHNSSNVSAVVTDPNVFQQDLKCFYRVKMTLESLLENVPACTQSLLDALKSSKNAASHPTAHASQFGTNFLYILSFSSIVDVYVNSRFAQEILDFLFDRLILVDNQIDMNELQIARETSDSDMEYMFRDSPSINKLDLSMYTLLHHFKKVFHTTDGQLNWPVVRFYYKKFFLTLFDKYMLRSQIPNQAQFWMFYICNLKVDLAVGFIDFLFKRLQDPASGIHSRVLAVTYMASFVTHSQQVTGEVVITVLQKMYEWMLHYLETSQNAVCNYQRHKLFYSVFLSYVDICLFRQADIFDKSQHYHEFLQMKLKIILTSSLVPLRFCSPTILSEFEQLLECYHVGYLKSVFTASKNLAAFTRHQQHMYDYSLPKPFSSYYLTMSADIVQPMMRSYRVAVKSSASMRISGKMEDLSLVNGCSEASTQPIAIPLGKSEEQNEMAMSASPAPDISFPFVFESESEQVFLGRKY